MLVFVLIDCLYKLNEGPFLLFEICLQNNLSKLYSSFLCLLVNFVIIFKFVAGLLSSYAWLVTLFKRASLSLIITSVLVFLYERNSIESYLF